MPAGQAELNDPLLAQLERGVDPCIGEGINGVEQRVRHVVVVRRQLRFDPGNREESADSDVQAVLDRKVEVNILEDRIEPILAVKL
jgi:hypothetical protein